MGRRGKEKEWGDGRKGLKKLQIYGKGTKRLQKEEKTEGR